MTPGDMKTAGSAPDPAEIDERRSCIDYIRLKLALTGPALETDRTDDCPGVPPEMVAYVKARVRAEYGGHSALERRVQNFVDRYLAEVGAVALPGLGQTLVLDRPGMARELSLPENGDAFESDIVHSYRLMNGQGVLHNPKADRRTTEGVFHVAEGGLPVPDDKKSVPVATFARVLAAAFQPPPALLTLPFTAGGAEPVMAFATLQIRPLVVPAVPGVTPARTMETEFVAPGNLVSNLDFIERIFGNAGDGHLPSGDAGLDPQHWTGHTGYVVLAPHLIYLTKKEVGLPHVSEATERQRRDGMCWEREDEHYNDGGAFKLTARDQGGVTLTIIADNYFGYCKKEVKTQISFAANLGGWSEEEHAGGALVFPQYDEGKRFVNASHHAEGGPTFDSVVTLLGDRIDVRPEGYAVDRTFPEILYLPHDARIELDAQMVTWKQGDQDRTMPLAPDKVYVLPDGFKVRLEREQRSGAWRLVGTVAEPTYCHKPSTVSGGGKSEISKPIDDAVLHGPVFIADFEKDMDAVEALVHHDYTRRFRDSGHSDDRSLLSSRRSVGSVIKLLTPSETIYTPEYNRWLERIPPHIKKLTFLLKRLYRPEWGDDWRAHFSVDEVNGRPGNELKFHNEKLIAHYVRVGFTSDGHWRIFSLRDDYVPAEKLQMEDDISASLVVPAEKLSDLSLRYRGQTSYKIVSNCESRLFQRPDDAIVRGYDRATEAHFARPGNFFSNYEPLTDGDARAMKASPITFDQYTEPMKRVIAQAANGHGFFTSSSEPRRINGAPSKNPRYLQVRSDLDDPRGMYLAELGARLARSIPYDRPLHTPVNAVLPGRRLNPPDAGAGIRPLAVYNPIHWQDTPELFMELISSLTGKSPSTTGAGSEGALTKGPFNSLLPIVDLNDAYVSHLLTGTQTFVTAAGYVGPQYRVDHDISLVVPEIWSRMEAYERDPFFLYDNGYMEALEDFDYKGERVLASRLGRRINAHFVRTFFGRVFDNPGDVFTPDMLAPEKQDMAAFVDGVGNIVDTQRRIASGYFRDGSIDIACPPLRVLLHIMRDGHYEGKSIQDSGIRALFTPEAMLNSDWYAERLSAQQRQDGALWRRHAAYIESFLSGEHRGGEVQRRAMQERLEMVRCRIESIERPEYPAELRGFLGVDPSVVAE